MEGSIQEGDVRKGLQGGGCLRSVVIVTSRTDEGPRYQAYLRASWRERYAPLATYKGRSARKYRDIGRLFQLIRDGFRFEGAIAVYVEGDAALRRKAGLEFQPVG